MARTQPTQTLFLPELPSELSESALERHFRGFTGFESCRMRNDRTGKVVGFVEFDRVEDAARARESMLDRSPFSGEPWNIQFSTNPSRAPVPKRSRDDAGQPRHEAVRNGNMGPPSAPPGKARPPASPMPAPPPVFPSAPPLPVFSPPPPVPPGFRVPAAPPPMLHHYVSAFSDASPGRSTIAAAPLPSPTAAASAFATTARGAAAAGRPSGMFPLAMPCAFPIRPRALHLAAYKPVAATTRA
eukprot:scaffold10573_cov109-Isochrysis_galbana.AAC.1